MKKIIITILASIALTSSSALAGSVQIGATISNMWIDAAGTETTTAGDVTGGAVNTNKATANNMAIIPALYLEYSFDDASWAGEGNGITLGVSMVEGTADVSDSVSSRSDTAEDDAGSGSTGAVTYEAQAEVSNYVNYYLEMPIVESLYVKAGLSQIDLVTKEDADHEGSYGDVALDGLNLGVGFKGLYGNYAWKFAYEVTNWDDINLTSTTSNKIAADIDTESLNLSVGYRF